MSRFGSDPHAFFTSVYEGVAPWDTGEAQPAMVRLLADLPPSGPALDLGCGSGDLALHLARNGVDTLGIDFVDAAIELARARAADLPAHAGALRFEVADALHPSRLGRSFGAVTDSGFFHLFTADEGDRLVAEIASVLAPGGRLYLHEFATEFPIPNSPRAISEEELRGRFTVERGWKLLAVGPGPFLNRIAPVPGIAACVERLPGPAA